jgi:hypothetical protein
VQGRLTDLFGGAAAANANTYAGQIARVQVAFDEAKETLGTALLPILDKLLKFINENALPAINAFSNAFSLTESDGFGKIVSDVGTTLKKTFTPIIEGVKSVFDSVKTAVINSKDEFASFWEVVKFIAPLIGKAIGDSLRIIGDIAEIVITIIGKVLGAIKPLINFAIDGINLIIKAYNAIPFVKNIPLIPKIGEGGSTATGAVGNYQMSTGTVLQTPADQAALAASKAAGLAEAKIIVAGQAQGLTAAQSLAAAAAASSSNVVSSNFNPGAFRAAEAATSGTTINLTVTGAIDSEGTARTIVDTLNNSFYRGTGGANSLQIA